MPTPLHRLPCLAAALALGALAQPAPAAAAGLLDGPRIARPMPTGEFRKAPAYPVSQPRAEAIQGEPNFVKIGALDPADPNRALSAMVGQVWYRHEDGFAPHCTGFLVGAELFLTNYHCVADMATQVPDDPRRLAIAMEHIEQGQVGGEESISAVTGVIKMDYLLDYALVRLERPLGERYGWLALETDAATIAAVDHVKIIQHPAGRSKEIVLEETRMVQQDALFLHYLADTEGGSSGSPVFALDGSRVIGLHHAGTNQYNEGLAMARIAAEIALYLPGQAQPTGPAPVPVAATGAAAGAPAAAPAAAAAQGPGGNPGILGLLLEPPRPAAEGERPLSLGIVPPGRQAGGSGQEPAPAAGMIKLEWD